MTLNYQEIYATIHRQAQLHLTHNVHSCRSERSLSNKWLFKCGMEQGIQSALNYLSEESKSLLDNRQLAILMTQLQNELLKTCELMPYKAVELWGLTELDDLLDIEREDVIKGIKHGINAVTLTLPRMIREQKKGPKLGPKKHKK